MSARRSAELAGGPRRLGGWPPVLAWLVAQFPTSPLPTMLQPLTSGQLEGFRDLLAASFRRSTLGT